MGGLYLRTRTIRLIVAIGVAIAAMVIATGASMSSTSAAATVAGALPIPRPDGLTVGFAGTNDPRLLTNAQPFEVASLSTFDITSQTWRSYVPRAPAFANSLTARSLQPEHVVFARRSSRSTLIGAAIPIAGAPLIEVPEVPQRFQVPPTNGLTLGVSGTPDPGALVDVQFFTAATMNVWDIRQQRYLTFIPGAPTTVNTLTAANLKTSDIVWLKALGSATGGLVLEDTPFVARLVPFGEAGTLRDIGQPSFGVLVDNRDGTVTYTPDDNFSGDDSFTYTVVTADGPEVRIFRLEVRSENDPPIAKDDAATAASGLATLIAVLDNDEDPDDDPLTILRTTQPANGVVAIVGNAVLYTPQPNFDGTDTFQYEVTDGIAEPGDPDAIATVFVAVGGAALAGPPPAGGGGAIPAPGAGGGEIPEDGAEPPDEGAAPPFLSDDSIHFLLCDTPRIVDVLANDAGDGVTVLVVSSVSPPALGTTTNNGDGTITYTPPLACTGSDSFSYTVPDADGVQQSAIVSVTMGAAGPSAGGDDDPAPGAGENQAPVAVDDSATTLDNQPVVISVLANDSDPDSDPLTISALSQPTGGSATNNGNGTVTYAANGFVGQTSFTYTISDGRGGTATAAVSVTVESVPVAPVGPVVVQSGGQVAIQVVAPSTFVQLQTVTNGSHGSTSMNVGSGTVTYQPEAGYVGDDWITWTLLFSHGGTAQTTLQLRVVQ